MDEGAARALREGSASLLPVGVVEVIGEFDAGDAVEIAARDGTTAGRGGTLGEGDLQLHRRRAAAVAGLKSEAVREILPRASDEAVHRDYLVLE